MPKYSIILPTYNERDNLPVIVFLIFEMAEKNKLDFEIVIVEDNSPDGTAEVARQLEEYYKGKIKILNRPGKMGLGFV
jgi:dolichol-phosphate mannosyltransferase